MSADEPLYCRACGAEDWDCACADDAPGPYCETCGAPDCGDAACASGDSPAELGPVRRC